MKSHKNAAAFTLVELLVVLAIIAIMATLVIPATTSLIRSSNLTAAGDQVAAILNLARQHAMARNRAVEVRWYRFADPNFAGEVITSPATGHFRAMQAFEDDGTGNLIPFTKMQRLPNGIIMDSSVTYSPLIPDFTGTTTTVQIPLVGTSYNYSAFRYEADGSTNINTVTTGTSTSWCLTLHNISDGADPLTAVPKNYVTVVVDPTDGIPIVYRP
jgi:uncharacterized protein (TIGR02596 family)